MDSPVCSKVISAMKFLKNQKGGLYKHICLFSIAIAKHCPREFRAGKFLLMGRQPKGSGPWHVRKCISQAAWSNSIHALVEGGAIGIAKRTELPNGLELNGITFDDFIRCVPKEYTKCNCARRTASIDDDKKPVEDNEEENEDDDETNVYVDNRTSSAAASICSKTTKALEILLPNMNGTQAQEKEPKSQVESVIEQQPVSLSVPAPMHQPQQQNQQSLNLTINLNGNHAKSSALESASHSDTPAPAPVAWRPESRVFISWLEPLNPSQSANTDQWIEKVDRAIIGIEKLTAQKAIFVQQGIVSLKVLLQRVKKIQDEQTKTATELEHRKRKLDEQEASIDKKAKAFDELVAVMTKYS